ncbi:uncharacterized protein IL334_001161 [Kwoniella shivajii]|uniref:Nucleolar protein Dnt1-like N-terminal domain-containing protein n=1 Tax=Kwoniella shivajii TaxID=564305 RepID=A0ABZ1CSA9_9TREE|nr:hypothetical protein IL334_001161 [Kwoniella shivajii]
MGKNSRVSMTESSRGNFSPYPAGPSSSMGHSPVGDGSDKGPVVFFQLADGSNATKRRLKPNNSLESLLPRIIDKLDLDVAPQQVRLAHIRDQGREVDILDGYDFAAFQRRAFDNPSTINIVRVYVPASSTNPVHSSFTLQQPQSPSPAGFLHNDANIFETPKSRSKKDKKRKRKQEKGSTPQVETPIQAYKHISPVQPSAQTINTPTLTKSQLTKQRKRNAAVDSLSQSPTLPSPSEITPTLLNPRENAGPENDDNVPTPKSNNKGNKKRKRQSEAAESPISTSTSSYPALESARLQKETSGSPEKKKKKKKNKSKSPQKPSPAVETAKPSTASSSTQVPTSDTNTALPAPLSQLNRYKPVKPSPLGRVPTPSIDGDDETVEQEPPKSARKPRKTKKQKLLEEEEEAARIALGKSAEGTMEGQSSASDAVEEDENIDETPTTPIAGPSTLPDINVPKRRIPLSIPNILYVRPNDILPFISTKYNSSTFDRPPQRIYVNSSQRSRKKVEQSPEADEDAMSLEEEERPKSPSPPIGNNTDQPAGNAEEIAQPFSEPDPQQDPVPVTVAKVARAVFDSDIVEKPTKVRNRKKSNITAEIMKHPREAVAAEEAEKEEDTRQRENAETQEQIDDGVPDQAGSGKKIPEEMVILADISQPDQPRGSPAPPPVKKNKAILSASPSLENPKIRHHLPSVHHIEIASRGGCRICGGPCVLEKDCPEVHKGVGRLYEILEEKKKLKNRTLREDAVGAIESWIRRLSRVSNIVKGTGSPPSASKIHAVPFDRTSLTSLPIIEKASPITASRRRSTTPPDSAEPSEVPQTPSPSPSISPEPTPIPAQTSQPVSSPPREHSAPPIYLKALSRKAGSVSGLSASDAIIETGSSASESESDNGSGSESDSAESGAESVGSKRSSTSSTRTKSRSRSNSASSAVSSTSSQPKRNPEISKIGPTPSLEHFLSLPLSQKQKQAARISAAAMQDIEMEEEPQDASDIETTPEPQIPPSSFARARRGSESSLGEFADDTVESRSDQEAEEDEVTSFTQPPNLQPSQATETVETAPEINQKSASPRSDQSRRSFAELEEAASPTPVVAEFPGSIALQEAIDEDAAHERLIDMDQPGRIEEVKTGHVISQGLMSPPSSTEEDIQASVEPMPGTQVINGNNNDEEATPRPLRRRVTRTSGKAIAELAPPADIRLSSSQPAPSSPPRRRLRSASRELTAEPMSPRITTRRISASQPEPSHRYRSISPSTHAPIRRSTRRTTPSSQVDELASSPAQLPRRNSRRGTTPVHSSQADQLESSPPPVTRTPAPIPEEDESELEEDAAESRIPGGLKTPLVPESQHSQSQPESRRGSRSKPSPLFMSQGSQIPQTQAYNLYPNLPSSDTGMSLNETPKGKTGNVLESPTSIRKTNGLGRKASLRVSSPIIEEEEEQHLPSTSDLVKDSQPEQDESDVEINGNEKDASASSSSSSASEDEEELPIPTIPKLRSSSLYPALPRSSIASQPANSFPTLSSLPKDVLRKSKSTFGLSASQPMPSLRSNRMSLPAQSRNGNGNKNGFLSQQAKESDSSSESSDDSSDEEKTPVGLKNRIARGRQNNKIKRRASQANIGW